MAERKKHVAVIGGGISGLTTAKKLIEAGYDVDIYEASDKRLGGKIESGTIDGKQIDLGAEFLDSSYTQMIALAKELNVPLVKTKDQDTVVYQTAGGKRVSENDLLIAIKPIAQYIEQDKALLAKDPTGERAKQIDAMSPDQYMQELSARAQAEGPQLPLWKRATKFLFRWKEPSTVDPETIKTLAGIYSGESARDPATTSALQFVHELNHDLSLETGELLSSDCGYRIDGGTQKIIEALEKDLRAKGASFHMGAKATAVRKDGDEFNITMEGQKEPVEADQVVLALPAYALKNIEGLDALGMTPEALDTVSKGQYTHNSKFFVRMKPGAEKLVPNEAFFSGSRYETWQHPPGVMTFLIGGEEANTLKGKKMVQYYLDSYAKAYGTTADKLFDIDTVELRGPDMQKPCYASPAPGQALAYESLSHTFDKMAAKGVGIVGTFIPSRSDDGMSIGFMECGVESANHTVEVMTGMTAAQRQALAVAQEYPLTMEQDGPAAPVTPVTGRGRA